MVLLSMSGSVGSVAVALDDWTYPINSNQDIAKIIPAGVSPFYLAAYLSCRFGQVQIDRLPVGSVQQHVFLWMIERIQIPRFAAGVEDRIASLARQAYRENEAVAVRSKQAEGALLSALGLAQWSPPKPLSYTVRSADVQAAMRIDAEFYNPKHQFAERFLDALPHRLLGDVASFVQTGPAWPSSAFLAPGDPNGTPFIRIRNCKPGLIETAALDRVSNEATQVFSGTMGRAGDIAIGMDGIKWFYAGVLDGEAYINQRVGWLRLPPDAPDPLLVQLFINSPLGQAQLLRRMTIAQTVGHITLEDIRAVRVPDLAPPQQAAIVAMLTHATMAKINAERLLSAAKRVVEVAIEEGERAALVYLEEVEREV